MAVTFIHTADWQLGKPYSRIDNIEKRAILKNHRFESLKKIGELAEQHGASFIVAAGDLFDSSQPTREDVSRACDIIGGFKRPVFAIPGNHDFGGPGGPYSHDYFNRERECRAPNLKVLLTAEPVEGEGFVLLPCPLLSRHETGDPTEWLRIPGLADRFAGKARIVLAHGSISTFGTDAADDDEVGGHSTPNVLNLEMLDPSAFDYIALGDWHGTRRADSHPCAWYSGTHEPDRFPKGDDYKSGQVLLVQARRNSAPVVQPLSTGRCRWHIMEHSVDDADPAARFLAAMNATVAGHPADSTLVRLCISGSLSLASASKLERELESQKAALAHIRIKDLTTTTPTDAEIARLGDAAVNPLVAAVATKLRQMAAGNGAEAVTARAAIRELFNLAHETRA
ncbi:MAG: DNA repair exonuclease [Planctomycetes bacterium]|nr:DNA repair exonuclease [Planctomycetota bacterium]